MNDEVAAQRAKAGIVTIKIGALVRTLQIGMRRKSKDR